MTRTLHPYRGEICPRCKRHLFTPLRIEVRTAQLAEEIAEEVRAGWPVIPELQQPIQDWLTTSYQSNLMQLASLDHQVGLQKLIVREDTPEKVFPDIGFTEVFYCPGCKTPMKLLVSTRILKAVPVETEADRFTKGERQLLNWCWDYGIIPAFKRALEFDRRDHGDTPKGDPEALLLRFLKKATQRNMPAGLAEKLEITTRETSPLIFMWTAEYVRVITYNDNITHILPANVANMRDHAKIEEWKNLEELLSPPGVVSLPALLNLLRGDNEENEEI